MSKINHKKPAIKKTSHINSLYLHIPFCHHLCFYCDFPKLLILKGYPERYLVALIDEIKSLKITHPLKTIYIGGGTPSAINLTRLFKALTPYINQDTEFTVEGNVLDFNEALLKEYKRYHVNRISLGVQAMDDALLKILGRQHHKADVINKVKLIKKYIPNINVDLIYGFKELTKRKLLNELDDYLSLKPTHISTYALEIHKGTKFYQERKELDQDVIREQFDLIYKHLTTAGYHRYEISNFAKKGYEAKHNLTYWNDNEYYGCGLGAAGYVNNVRYKNTLNINEYIKGHYRMEEEKITQDDDKKYYLMLNLRKSDGVDLDDYQKRFRVNLLNEKNTVINKLIKQKLLKIKYTNLVTTYEGSMLLDIILRELF